MRIPSNGEIIPADTACCGEIVILTNDTLKLNDTLGNVELLPRKAWEKNPIPLLRTTVEPQNQEQRDLLLNALTEIADTDPLLHYYVDTITHEIIISFLGTVQLEVICSLLIVSRAIPCEHKCERTYGHLSGKAIKNSQLHDSY